MRDGWYGDEMTPFIEIVKSNVSYEIENEIMRAVHRVGVIVDKERLVQALTDAKAFWREGYAAALRAGGTVQGEWVEWYPPKHMIMTGEELLYRCSACDAKYADVEGYRYCPHCGAKMGGAEDV